MPVIDSKAWATLGCPVQSLYRNVKNSIQAPTFLFSFHVMMRERQTCLDGKQRVSYMG